MKIPVISVGDSQQCCRHSCNLLPTSLIAGHAKFLLNCCCSVVNSVWLLCNPVDCTPPGSSVHGIFQARTLEWVAISFPRGSSWTRYQTHISCISRQILSHWTIREALHLIVNENMDNYKGCWASLVAQMVKHLPAMWETWVWFLGQEDPLGKEMATHSSTLAWKIPWMESLVGYSPWDRKEWHDWATSLSHSLFAKGVDDLKAIFNLQVRLFD